MLYVYLIASAALVPILNNFYPILKTDKSWWLVPVLFIGFFLCFLILHIGIFALSILFVNKDKEYDNPSKYYRFIVKMTLPLIFKLGRVDIKVTGEEKLPENRKVMLVSNHIHDFDPAVIISSFPDLQLGFIAKKEVYTLFPFVAKLMARLDCLPIDRENNREGVKAILKAVGYIKSGRASIGIFPEGYTSKDGELQEFRNGAFKIATRSKAPIVVCTLVNSDKIVKNMFRRKTTVYLDVLEVIEPTEFEGIHTDVIGERVHKEMKENIAKRRESDSPDN